MRPGRTTAWLPANTVTLVTGSSTSGAWLAGGAAAGFRSTLPWGHSQTIGMASAGACATFLITARRCGRRVWPSRRRGQMPVSGEGRGPRTPETSASLPMRASRHVSVWFALRTTYERVAGRSADACLCGRTVAMALARRLPSGSVIEPVAARPDTLALGPRSTGVSREAALDRIPGDGMSREPFDGGVGLPHVHRAISLRQRFDDGPLNHAVAQTKLPRRLRRGSGQAALHRAEPGTGQRSPTSVSLRRTATHRSGRPLLRLRREGADHRRPERDAPDWSGIGTQPVGERVDVDLLLGGHPARHDSGQEAAREIHGAADRVLANANDDFAVEVRARQQASFGERRWQPDTHVRLRAQRAVHGVNPFAELPGRRRGRPRFQGPVRYRRVQTQAHLREHDHPSRTNVACSGRYRRRRVTLIHEHEPPDECVKRDVVEFHVAKVADHEVDIGDVRLDSSPTRRRERLPVTLNPDHRTAATH